MTYYSPPVIIANIIKKAKPKFSPKLGIILGSGMGDIIDLMGDKTIIPYWELPKFHVCTVHGHPGNLCLGNLSGLQVVCMQGRAHIYEGIETNLIKNLIRPLKLIGCDTVLLTAAVGSLRPEVGPGSFVLVNDHINLQGINPLIGINEDEFGPRFPSMENAYDEDLRHQIHNIADRLAIKLHDGVYLATSGPSFETPAEIRAFATLGADVVGMSTAAETIVARHCGLKVAAIANVTNLAAGLQKTPLSHEETLTSANLSMKNLSKLISGFCEELSNAK